MWKELSVDGREEALREEFGAQEMNLRVRP